MNEWNSVSTIKNNIPSSEWDAVSSVSDEWEKVSVPEPISPAPTTTDYFKPLEYKTPETPFSVVPPSDIVDAPVPAGQPVVQKTIQQVTQQPQFTPQFSTAPASTTTVQSSDVPIITPKSRIPLSPESPSRAIGATTREPIPSELTPVPARPGDLARAAGKVFVKKGVVDTWKFPIDVSSQVAGDIAEKLDLIGLGDSQSTATKLAKNYQNYSDALAKAGKTVEDACSLTPEEQNSVKQSGLTGIVVMAVAQLAGFLPQVYAMGGESQAAKLIGAFGKRYGAEGLSVVAPLIEKRTPGLVDKILSNAIPMGELGVVQGEAEATQDQWKNALKQGLLGFAQGAEIGVAGPSRIKQAVAGAAVPAATGQGLESSIVGGLTGALMPTGKKGVYAKENGRSAQEGVVQEALPKAGPYDVTAKTVKMPVIDTGIDQLTGLESPNITKEKLLSEQTAIPEKQRNVLFLDIDEFKKVNDEYGHDVGDQILSKTGDMLKKHFGTDAELGRFGGEELSGIFNKDPSPEALKAFLDDFSTNVRTPDGHAITISGGLAKGRTLNKDGTYRLSADKQLYNAKESGRNAISIEKSPGNEYIIKGTDVGEKPYVTKYNLRNLATGARQLLSSAKLSAPEDRIALERAIQTVERLSEGKKPTDGTATAESSIIPPEGTATGPRGAEVQPKGATEPPAVAKKPVKESGPLDYSDNPEHVEENKLLYLTNLKTSLRKKILDQPNGQEQWDYLIGKKIKRANGKNIVKTDKTIAALKDIYDYQQTEEATAFRKANNLPENIFSDFEDVASQIQSAPHPFELKKVIEAIRSKRAQKEEEAMSELQPDINQETQAALDEAAAERAGMQEETLSPTGREEDSYLRPTGTEGSIGGEKPFEVKPDPTGPAEKYAESLKKGVEDTKKHFKTTLREWLDARGAEWVDINYGIKRLLSKIPKGQAVIDKLIGIKGWSDEALAQSEAAEHTIYKNLPKKYDEVLGSYSQAMRTIEVEKLKDEGKLNLFGDEVSTIKSTGGMTAKEAGAWVEAFKKQDPKGFAAVENARAKQKAEYDNQLQQLADEGLITQKTKDQLSKEHAYYFPRKFIQHIDPVTKTVDATGRTVDSHGSGLKALQEGSEQAMITNPRYLLNQVIARTQNRIAQNRANKALFELIKNNPENAFGGKIQEGETPAGYRSISAWVDGVEQKMLLPRKMAKYWVTSDPAMNQTFAKFANIVSGSFLVKPLATGVNPEFAIGNIFRDMAHAMIATREYSSFIPKAIVQEIADMARVLPDVLKRSGRVRQYTKEGGGMKLLTQQGYNAKAPWENPSNIDLQTRALEKTAGYLGETSELLMRLAIRERAIKNGKTPEEATIIARNYIDFSQGGSIAKGIDHAVPYFNAGIQGTRGVIRAFREDPKRAIFQVAQIGALGYGLAYWNSKVNKEAWDSISEKEKESRFIITTPYSYKDADGKKRWIYLGIPKDQGQRAFAATGEVIADKQNSNISTETAFKRVGNALSEFLPTDATTMLPPTVAAYMGYVNNKDFWSKEDIWKGKDVAPSDEYWKSTPKIFKDIGAASKKMNEATHGITPELSPERLKGAVGKVLPKNIYTDIMGGAWKELSGAINPKDKEAIEKTMIEQMVSSPGIRKIIRASSPSNVVDEVKEAGLKEVRKSNRESIDLNDRAREYVAKLDLNGRRLSDTLLTKPFFNSEKSLAINGSEKPKRSTIFAAYKKAFAEKVLDGGEIAVYKAPSLAARRASAEALVDRAGLEGEERKAEILRLMHKNRLLNPQKKEIK